MCAHRVVWCQSAPVSLMSCIMQGPAACSMAAACAASSQLAVMLLTGVDESGSLRLPCTSDVSVLRVLGTVNWLQVDVCCVYLLALPNICHAATAQLPQTCRTSIVLSGCNLSTANQHWSLTTCTSTCYRVCVHTSDVQWCHSLAAQHICNKYHFQLHAQDTHTHQHYTKATHTSSVQAASATARRWHMLPCRTLQCPWAQQPKYAATTSVYALTYASRPARTRLRASARY